MSSNAYVNKMAEENSKVQAPLWARIYDVVNKRINNSNNDIKKQIVRGVTHPTQIPTIVNETAIEPIVNTVSAVPAAAGNLISPRNTEGESIPRTSRQTFSDLTRVGLGAVVPLAVLSPARAFLSSGGGLPGLSALVEAQAALTSTDLAIGSVINGAYDRQQNKKFIQERLIPQGPNWNNKPRIFTEGRLSLESDIEKNKIKELDRAIFTEPTTPKSSTSPDLFLNLAPKPPTSSEKLSPGIELKAPFVIKANQQIQDIKDQELYNAFRGGFMTSPQSDKSTTTPAAATTTPEQKPSILKILKDHKGWIAGAAAGGLVLGIAKNYMDKREEAENKKKQQRRLFLQSQYPLLHP